MEVWSLWFGRAEVGVEACLLDRGPRGHGVSLDSNPYQKVVGVEVLVELI